MKEQILLSLDNPGKLETLYQGDKQNFKRVFAEVYPLTPDNLLLRFWKERLEFNKPSVAKGSGREIVFIIIASVLAGLVAKLPAFLHLDEETFFQRNIGFIALVPLMAWFSWKNKLTAGRIVIPALISVAGLIFINLLPPSAKSDTILLSCFHLVLVLWFALGFTFVGETQRPFNRLGFLSYNGDLAVITALLGIAGGILVAITLALFSIIGLDIRDFFFSNVIVFMLPALPLVATCLMQLNPGIVSRISPVIARIFTPLVTLMLVIYLVAMIWLNGNPYNNREFLIVFNVLLVGVMSLIFFSISERSSKGSTETLLLFILSLVTIIVNSVALSAILFRISEWGVTPNRVAVLGANLIILVNLLLVSWHLLNAVRKRSGMEAVGLVIARYLPVYLVWAIVVTFGLPFIFGFS